MIGRLSHEKFRFHCMMLAFIAYPPPPGWLASRLGFPSRRALCATLTRDVCVSLIMSPLHMISRHIR